MWETSRLREQSPGEIGRGFLAFSRRPVSIALEILGLARLVGRWYGVGMIITPEMMQRYKEAMDAAEDEPESDEDCGAALVGVEGVVCGKKLHPKNPRHEDATDAGLIWTWMDAPDLVLTMP